MKNVAERVKPLAVVERYDQAVAYLYPIIQTMPRRHGRYRDKLLDALLAVPGLIYVAAKSNQVSRIYHVDAGLAELRWLLRFAASPAQKLITPHQHEVASVHLAEVGKMVGAWQRNRRCASFSLPGWGMPNGRTLTTCCAHSLRSIAN